MQAFVVTTETRAVETVARNRPVNPNLAPFRKDGDAPEGPCGGKGQGIQLRERTGVGQH